MSSEDVGSRRMWYGGVGAREEIDTLRARWRTASLAAGWPFPGDWSLPEVEHVCLAVVTESDPLPSLRRLGRARAAAGQGLSETLGDLAALHAVTTFDVTGGLVGVDADATPARLLRPTALAWAEVAVDRQTPPSVSDALTGLATSAYLRTRLAEVYREATVDGGQRQEYGLLVYRLDLSVATGWSRLVSMVLLADVLRAVFDSGETVASLGPSAAGVLAPNSVSPAKRTLRARWLASERLAVDPQLHDVTGPEVERYVLPATHGQACELLARVGHG